MISDSYEGLGPYDLGAVEGARVLGSEWNGMTCWSAQDL
jgi:hypothetical protein